MKLDSLQLKLADPEFRCLFVPHRKHSDIWGLACLAASRSDDCLALLLCVCISVITQLVLKANWRDELYGQVA